MVRGSQELIFLSFPPSLSFSLFFFFIRPLSCVSGFGFRQKQWSSVGDASDMLASGSTSEKSGTQSLCSFYTKWENVEYKIPHFNIKGG